MTTYAKESASSRKCILGDASTWFAKSANEWTASASITWLEVMNQTPTFKEKTRKLQTSATTTALWLHKHVKVNSHLQNFHLSKGRTHDWCLEEDCKRQSVSGTCWKERRWILIQPVVNHFRSFLCNALRGIWAVYFHASQVHCTTLSAVANIILLQ